MRRILSVPFRFALFYFPSAQRTRFSRYKWNLHTNSHLKDLTIKLIDLICIQKYTYQTECSNGGYTITHIETATTVLHFCLCTFYFYQKTQNILDTSQAAILRRINFVKQVDVFVIKCKLNDGVGRQMLNNWKPIFLLHSAQISKIHAMMWWSSNDLDGPYPMEMHWSHRF